MTSKKKFADGVVDAIRQLDERDYDYKNSIVYAHPSVIKSESVHGIKVESTSNLPENVIVVVHLDAMVLGPEAIAFATIDEFE